MSASRRRWLAVLLAAVALYAPLALPGRADGFSLAALRVFPAELAVILVVLAVVAGSRMLSLPVRLAVTVALIAAVIVKLMDIGMFTAFSRPFNLAYDLPLIPAGLNVLAGASGALRATAYVVMGLVALGGATALVWWATGVFSRNRASRGVLVSLSALAVAVVVIGAQEWVPAVASPTTRMLIDHAEAAQQARQDIAAVAREAEIDAFGDAPAGTLLSKLRGRDVIIAFVESYGRSSLDNPTYAPTTAAALADVEANLAAAGLVARSAWLTSPTSGGQSWLAHSTLLSGLWINSQGRYGALTASGRRTLLRLAAGNGWGTVGVMPAITQPWPEADFYGYGNVLAAKDLGYRGKPFNWVTMPDQYTWSAFERLALTPAPREPVFAEVALISSHAPWTPIPTLVPWDEVGDGRIFDAQASSGESPEKIWSDPDRVRDQFRQSIDYGLRTIGEFAARRAATAPLIVVLGDHQPAGFISGTDNRDVPIHIIGDAATIAHLDGWGWEDGMVPAANSPVWRMDAFRDRFLGAFSTPVGTHTGKDPSA